MYEISTDPRHNLVPLKLIGLLTPEEVTQLYRDEHAAIQSGDTVDGLSARQHLAIVDLTDCKIQRQEVAAAFGREIKSDFKAKRLAMYTGSPLARMQARRLMQRDDAALFATREEAESWLLQTGDSQAGPSINPG